MSNSKIKLKSRKKSAFNISKFLLFIAITTLPFSCKNRIEIIKREHKKGVHIVISQRPNKRPSNPIEKTKIEKLNPIENNTLVGSTDKKEFQILDNKESHIKENLEQAHATTSDKKKETLLPNQNKSTNTISIHQKFNPGKPQSIPKNESNKPSKASDVELVVLILLAIFLPPLAIYLKNEETDKWFWASLILCLATITIFYFLFGGLLWIAAMAIALMVVLELI